MLNSDCLPVTPTTLLETFSLKDFVWLNKFNASAEECIDLHSNSASWFDKQIQNQWENAYGRKVLNYDIATDLSCITKVLKGKFDIVSQLNGSREHIRRKREPFQTIMQAFNPEKFNFTKIKNEEILFEIKCIKEEENVETSYQGTVIVNVSPICPHHNLIIPDRMNCDPQIFNIKGLYLGISMILLSNSRYFKCCFNSLGAMASVNHNHWHTFYLDHSLYIETMDCDHIGGCLYSTKDYFAPGFVFIINQDNMNEAMNQVMIFIKLLLEEEISHNIMITRGTSKFQDPVVYDAIRVVVWARTSCFEVTTVSGFSSAVMELSGYVPVYDEETWNTISEERVTSKLADVTAGTFNEILPKVKLLFAEVKNTNSDDKAAPILMH